MKKVLLGILAIMSFAACQKAKQSNESKSENLSAIIRAIGKQYHTKVALMGDTNGNGPHPPDPNQYGCRTRKCKINHLLLADAIGGIIGGGATQGKTEGYGALWGGFLATLSAEPYYRYPPSGNGNNSGSGNNNGSGNGGGKSTTIYIPEDNHDSFTFGDIGYYHNVLMKDALDSGLNVTIEEGHINTLLANLMLANNFFDAPDISDTFGHYEPLLVNTVQYLDSYIVDSNLNSEGVISNLQVDSNVRNTISTIYDQIQQIDSAEVGSFLLNVNGAVLSASLPENDKDKILVFVAVANSSYYFWNANLD